MFDKIVKLFFFKKETHKSPITVRRLGDNNKAITQSVLPYKKESLELIYSACKKRFSV